MTTPNEKYVELLFTHHALQFGAAAGMTVYAPTSREEHKCGYDAHFMGRDRCAELYIQYKRPHPRQDGLLTIRTLPGQHDLMSAYKERTAYYVAAVFQDGVELEKRLQAATAPDAFLDYFIAIDARALDPTTQFMHFNRLRTGGLPGGAAHKRESDGHIKHAPHRIDRPGWMTGRELFRRFCVEGNVGSLVTLARAGRPVRVARREQNLRMGLQDDFEQGSDQALFLRTARHIEDKPDNYGLIFRLYYG